MKRYGLIISFFTVSFVTAQAQNDSKIYTKEEFIQNTKNNSQTFFELNNTQDNSTINISEYSINQSTAEDTTVSDALKKKLAQLKEGNDLVYFALDGAVGITTSKYDIIVIGKIAYIYINDKKVKLSEINNITKRSAIVYDVFKSGIYTRENGKKTLAFMIKSPYYATPDDSVTVGSVVRIDMN